MHYFSTCFVSFNLRVEIVCVPMYSFSSLLFSAVCYFIGWLHRGLFIPSSSEGHYVANLKSSMIQ